MAKYKAYPEYKDSGVEWLGKIPNHWTTLAIKHVAQLNPSKSCIGIEKMKGMCSFIPMEKLKFNSLCLDEIKNVTDVYNGYTYFENEDILIAKVTPCFENKNMVVAHDLNNGIGFGSSEIYVLRCNDIINNDFLFYRLQEDNFMSIAEGAMTGAGGLKRVPSEVLNNFKFGLPSKKEQSIIVDFLKHETAKIDKLIERQQQLIELLKEKRQAVISHAVTKGLNPDVPMKDSGVEWLGEIPQHWGVTRLKYECRNIVDCPHSTPNYTDEGEYPAIRTADILAGYLDLENCRRVTESVYDERNFRLIPKAGDIIYSREGERFGIGAPIPEGAKVCLAQRVMLFRAKSTPGYLMWALNSSSTYTQAQQDCIGSTSPHVNVDTIKNFILAWPPENEREEISNFIHQTLDSVESLTAHLTEKLTLLQERRAALISAAVTGKIDVRDWIAPEAQDVEEPQEATA